MNPPSSPQRTVTKIHPLAQRSRPHPRPPKGERKLIARASNGDAAAFLSLVSKQELTLRNAIYAVINEATGVDDVMQETYIKAYRSLPQFDQRSRFSTWLYRIAMNAALDFRRRNANIIPMDDSWFHGRHPSASSTSSVSPRHSTSSSEQQVVGRLDLLHALQNLTEAQRTASVLTDLVGFDLATGAEICGVPLSTFATRVRTARQQLRTQLQLDSGERR